LIVIAYDKIIIITGVLKMTQDGKYFVCSLCGKEIQVLKEGGNPAAPSCCGQEMDSKD
jgi:hypothetical protein